MNIRKPADYSTLFSKLDKISSAFPLHGFHNLLLELRCISLVRYSLWHNIAPHFLVQVFYHTCLTNGVVQMRRALFYTPHPEEDKRLGMPPRPMSKPSGSTGLPKAGAFPQIPCPALAGADRL